MVQIFIFCRHCSLDPSDSLVKVRYPSGYLNNKFQGPCSLMRDAAIGNIMKSAEGFKLFISMQPNDPAVT